MMMTMMIHVWSRHAAAIASCH